ncbi:MAG: hypothetical protein NTX48_10785 [Planctomycetales bacterium]|nr:hypothetical protein [Planctomycetales bacterium]
MVKWITVTIVAGLFFLVGLFAGHSVPSQKMAIATDRNAQAKLVHIAELKPILDLPMQAIAADDFQPISFVSHAAAEENKERLTTELLIAGPLPDDQRTAIRSLIHQHFPHTDAVDVEIWVETYADMNLDEIAFVLEQKRLTSKTIGVRDSASLTSLLPSVTHPVLATQFHSSPEQSSEIAIRAVETNLRSAYSLGFRRTVVLPEAITDSKSSFAAQTQSVSTTSFRSFQSGTLISSPIGTHVALTNEHSTMFWLEGNCLTRRGDFQVLADRRLGIVTRNEEIAAAESTPLPEGATDVQVAQNGTIQFKDAAGETCEAGQIALCIVKDLAAMKSADGVFFTVRDAGDVMRREDASAFLLTKMLEQSNVDPVSENSLLTLLKSLPDDAVE